jgi:hypothetical protein
MELKFVIVIVAIVLVGLFFFSKSKSTGELDNKFNTSVLQKADAKNNNDKIIVIRNVKLDYLKKAIKQFCNNYNQEILRVFPKLILLENQFVITFQNDIEFMYFCYFVNYLKYPTGFSKYEFNPYIRAWCKTNNNDAWMTEEIVNKNVMIYIPDSDDEYDNVFLTTEDNLGYKLGFAIGNNHKKLKDPIFEYEKISVNIDELDKAACIYFK